MTKHVETEFKVQPYLKIASALRKRISSGTYPPEASRPFCFRPCGSRELPNPEIPYLYKLASAIADFSLRPGSLRLTPWKVWK